jgi:hypothetical protein
VGIAPFHERAKPSRIYSVGTDPHSHAHRRKAGRNSVIQPEQPAMIYLGFDGNLEHPEFDAKPGRTHCNSGSRA